MPDQTPASLTDEHLRIMADASHPDSHPEGQIRDMAAELLTARAGAREMGRHLVHLNQIALDATGMHDAIDETGDGDWGAVWENVAELGDRASTLENGLRKSQRRAAELEAFVADVACHGLRTDLNPTTITRSPEQRKAFLESYLRHADRALREDARRFVPDADRPYSAGRPRPAAKVEVVAECVTELDLLRAQDGER